MGQNMTRDSGPKEQLIKVARQNSLMMEYLHMEAWTPAMGAQLVCGIRPLPDGQEITRTAIGLDGETLHSSSERVANARHVLRRWNQCINDNSDEAEWAGRIPSWAFLNWCDEMQDIVIEGSKWYRLFQELMEPNSVPEFVASLATTTLSASAIDEKINQLTSEHDKKAIFPQATNATPFYAREASVRTKVKAGQPVGLPTQEIAALLDGLSGWCSQKWRKNLTDAAWPMAAITQPGRRGKGGAALWNPALLASLAKDNRNIPPHLLRNLFRDTAALRPWREEWLEYEDAVRRLSDKPVS